MIDRQNIARRIIARFVSDQGGNVADIRVEDGAYRWTTPDGRAASVGWVA